MCVCVCGGGVGVIFGWQHNYYFTGYNYCTIDLATSLVVCVWSAWVLGVCVGRGGVGVIFGWQHIIFTGYIVRSCFDALNNYH